MKLVNSITLLIAISVFFCAHQVCNSQILDRNLNPGGEAYALSFRPVTPSQLEVWITTSGLDSESRELASAVATPKGFEPATRLTDTALNMPGARYNGVPSFNPCDPNEAVIVSDRISTRSSKRSNDLYLVRFIGDRWTAVELGINSDYWDDTPAYSPDGKHLYFSSDRRKPGSGTADIYVTHRNGAQWSDPEVLATICTDQFHETSPFISNDNRMYFSSNSGGDQDIYVVTLDAATGIPITKPQSVEIAGVNTRGTDEYHPVITPGGSWFVFASNRNNDTGRGAFKLYYLKMKSVTTELQLVVTARTKVKDEAKLQFFGKLDSISSVKTNVLFADLITGERASLPSDANGRVTIALGSATQPGPWTDHRVREFVVTPEIHAAGYAAGIDTLILDVVSCVGRIDHTLYLDDTASRSKKCEFVFRTFNVPFFVTTYWCPTTIKYRSYTPCASLFTDDVVCETITQPEHCTTNEAYTYTFTPAKLTRSNRNAENCVAYREFEENGLEWAAEVDANIERMREEVRAALTESCVQEAVRLGYKVTVTYVGTTDDRSISFKCKYTGEDYEALRALAPNIEIDSAIQPFIRQGQKFNAGGHGGRAGGNQLLSDLRSMYFAILFDNLCTETIPEYRELKTLGKLTIKSRGQAIDMRNIPYAFKRAAGVEISVPDFEVISKAGYIPRNRSVMLCPTSSPCLRR